LFTLFIITIFRQEWKKSMHNKFAFNSNDPQIEHKVEKNKTQRKKQKQGAEGHK